MSNKNIIIITLDSFRFNYFNSNNTPNLFNFFTKMGFINSKEHYSNSHCTEPGLFSIIYGELPIKANIMYHYKNKNKQPKHFEYLKKKGYLTHFISGKNVTRKKYNNFGGINAHFIIDVYDEIELLDGNFDHGNPNDELILEKATQFIEKCQQNEQLFLLHCHLYSTHSKYYFPPNFEIYKPILSIDYDHNCGDQVLKKQKKEIINRYLNSVSYSDQLVANFLNKFSSNYIYAIGSDHGEEFWEQNLLGHSEINNFCKERFLTPFFIKTPNSNIQLTLNLSSNITFFQNLIYTLKSEYDKIHDEKVVTLCPANIAIKKRKNINLKKKKNYFKLLNLINKKT